MKTRSDFPMLTNNPDLVYLNNAATTFKPKSMIEAMDEYYEKYGVSAHKSVDSLGWKVEQKIDECRQKVASFVGACESSEIIFTRSCTTGLNMIARSLGDFAINEGDEILVSPTEHHANFLPWQELAKRKKAVLKFLPTNENGEILVENLEKNISDKTKIVAVTHVSN
ncbi:MAG: aminotransferase class V-fold PLP-dependent enzyme, partial [Pseudomonadales bacterium]|nr:aminotransferase class V-fold PLP-dependent enzyme [Pseudomonadales bacterium]